ncbi:MAG: hypothetical protein M1330_05015 [Armatimonadetes bacterium]|nr:hypothetical protein [Armatimonadota bacterium]
MEKPVPIRLTFPRSGQQLLVNVLPQWAQKLEHPPAGEGSSFSEATSDDAKVVPDEQRGKSA